jgi:hypothetical protein
MRCALDEAIWKFELETEFGFAGCHLAVVGLVIFTS